MYYMNGANGDPARASFEELKKLLLNLPSQRAAAAHEKLEGSVVVPIETLTFESHGGAMSKVRLLVPDGQAGPPSAANVFVLSSSVLPSNTNPASKPYAVKASHYNRLDDLLAEFAPAGDRKNNKRANVLARLAALAASVEAAAPALAGLWSESRAEAAGAPPPAADDANAGASPDDRVRAIMVSEPKPPPPRAISTSKSARLHASLCPCSSWPHCSSRRPPCSSRRPASSLLLALLLPALLLLLAGYKSCIPLCSNGSIHRFLF